MNDDDTLLDRLRTGAAAALHEVLQRHSRPVYGYIRVRLGDAADADRLTRVVFDKLYAARKRIEPGTDLRAWLLATAQDLLRTHAHSSRRKRSGWADLCAELEDELAAPAGADAGMRLSASLESLPPSVRDALELRYRGNSFARIAERLRRSESAVRQLVFEGRQALRYSLAE